MDRAVHLSDVVARLEREGELVEAPAADPALMGAADDSRRIAGGELFCAWAGTQVDAHRFVPGAETAGAVAALVERPVPESTLPQVVVRDGRRAASIAAAAVYHDPSDALVLVGVTGTSGKTTTVCLLRHVLGARYAAASIGTLGVRLQDGRVLPGTEGLTTPGPVELARRLRRLADDGIRAVALEVSSHALEQGRVEGVHFDVAVFTNLSRDHLDYHGTVESYLAAKERLAERLRSGGIVVVNAADRAWDRVASCSPRVLRFALDTAVGNETQTQKGGDTQTAAGGETQAAVANGAQTANGGDMRVSSGGTRAAATSTDDGAVAVRATAVELGPLGAAFRLEAGGDRVSVKLPLLGAHNVENALAAAAACSALGFRATEIAARLEEAPQVPGRLERIAETPCQVLRDYAHKPAALERALAALRPLVAGRLIVVFGAGGERDPGKRPIMGRVAETHADIRVVTSDNPRSEDPETIIDEIVGGMTAGSYIRQVDRREAIARALELAHAGDLVLLAGKGHETYQVLGTGKVPFDEREIVRQLQGGGRGSTSS